MFHVVLFAGRGVRRFADLFPSGTATLLGLAAGALALFAPQEAKAVAYATSLTNDNGTISFRLNDSADSVKVISGGTTTNDLGALPAGLHTFSLGITGSFQVSVFKSSGPGYLLGTYSQIGSDTNRLLTFVNQRGVAVNKNPASPYFGRIYVSVSQGGSNTTSTRVVTDGIYVLNADQTDALGQGDTALTGDLGPSFAGTNPPTPTPPNPEGPHRLFVGADDRLYVGDFGDTNGSLYVMGPDVTGGENLFPGPTGSGFPLFNSSGKTHGSIAAAHVEGSLSAGNLVVYVIDEDLQSNKDSNTQNERNSIWRWDIGAGPLPTTNSPVKVSSFGITFAAQLTDLARGPDGKFYKSQRRAEPADPVGSSANIFVISNDGATNLWNSLTESRKLANNQGVTDLVNETCALDVSPDGQSLAALRRDTNSISIFPLSGGIPDMTNRVVVPTLPGIVAGRDLGFDAAGNLYYVSSGQGLLRILSPGGPSTAVTGSDGTFAVLRPAGVSVEVTDPVASESGDTGSFSIFRDNTIGDLAVYYSLTGSAGNGVDYETNVLSAVIPAGSTNVVVTITAIDDNITEPVENLTLTILGSSEYNLRPPIVGSIAIADNEPAQIAVSTVDSTAVERFPSDTITFRVQRTGETNSELFVSFETAAGTAIAFVDYRAAAGQEFPAFFYLAAGQVVTTLAIEPIDDFDYEGDETANITILSGLDYTIGDPASANGRIIDNEQSATPYLFVDDFDTDTSSDWITRFGANNDIYDATVSFSYDYSVNNLPPAPNSLLGTTRGVYLQVNKTNGPATGNSASAGVNLYPAGRTFSGNYAIRADMYLSFDGSSTTEHALIGLNHSTLRTNRLHLSTTPSATSRGGDGVWVGIVTDASNSRDYGVHTYTNSGDSLPVLVASRTAASVANLITAPPYALAGSPANRPSGLKAWAEVELGQIDNVVTLKVNNYPIVSYTNTSGYVSGDIMIGHNDSADSIGSANNYVIWDNVRVLNLDFAIRDIDLSPTEVQIDFASPLGGLVTSFRLESKTALESATWDEVPGAVFSALPDGIRVVAPRNGDAAFYRIRRN
jgi:uncharacterized surface protein with fasciclin (FAS1) repeats